MISAVNVSTDKINIDDELESDCCEISHFGHDEILSILLSK